MLNYTWNGFCVITHLGIGAFVIGSLVIIGIKLYQEGQEEANQTETVYDNDWFNDPNDTHS